MTITFKVAPPDLAADYVRLRGMTRQNAVSQQRLSALGITAQSWAQDIRSGELTGFVALSDQELVGYCFGHNTSGEIVVLALLPSFEGQGIGRRLLTMVVDLLHGLAHDRLFLACAADPNVRSHGFYRHLGWRSTGMLDERGDEILELLLP
jgi:GNAT superfamily N-acetyltransferase